MSSCLSETAGRPVKRLVRRAIYAPPVGGMAEVEGMAYAQFAARAGEIARGLGG